MIFSSPSRRSGGVFLLVVVLASFAASSSISAAPSTTVTWKVSSLVAGASKNLSAMVSTNSPGAKTWSKTGTCTLTPAKKPTTLIMGSTGSCVLTLKIAKSKSYPAKSSKKTITLVTPTTTTTALSTSVTCGADNGVFPNLTQTVGAGSGYDKPKVVVTCGGDTLNITSNGMISYPFVAKTPNGLKSQSYTWNITTKPKIASQQTSIKTTMGTIAFTVTGIPVFGPMEGPTPTQEAFGDPIFNNILDTCGGHTGYNADYHYHTIFAVSNCSLQETIIGYALDGFPIYSNPSYKLKSSYEKTGNPKTNSWDAYTYKAGSGSLDQCNGQKQSDGSYRYYVTESFPYVIGCYTGTAQAQSGAAAQPMSPMGPPSSVSKASAVRDNSNVPSQFVTSNTLLCTINRDDVDRL